LEESTNSYADQIIARTFENAARQPNDPDGIGQAAFKRADAPLIRRANILYKRAFTKHLTAKAIEQEHRRRRRYARCSPRPMTARSSARSSARLTATGSENVQRPVPGLGNNLKTLPVANRALPRKMTHDARRGLKHTDLVGNFGQLALHVLSVESFNTAPAFRHELGLSKDVQFAATAALVQRRHLDGFRPAVVHPRQVPSGIP
jgi:hypothetical protein